MTTKEFGVALRLQVEGQVENIGVKEIETILNKPLNDASEDGASIILSGEIDGVKELVN